MQQARVSTQAAPAERAVARLGELELGEGELQAVLDGLPPATREQLRADRGALEGWVRGRLAEKALLQQAQAQGWEERPDIQRLTRAATEQILLRTYLESVSQVPADCPGDAELQAAYEAGKDNWMTPALYRVSQIFSPSAPVRLRSRCASRPSSWPAARRLPTPISPPWRASIPRMPARRSRVATPACNRLRSSSRRCARYSPASAWAV